MQVTSRHGLQVNSIESMSVVDGPGMRFVVFAQGCPLRCKFCHNPETWGLHGGSFVGYNDLLNKLDQCRRFIPQLGLTISGGEPLMQARSCRELLMKAKERGVHTALDTSGFGDEDEFKSLLPFVDVLLYDIKAVDSELHIDMTGLSNTQILKNLETASAHGKKLWIRRILVPNVNDSPEEAANLGSLIRDCARYGNIERVDVNPYHRMGLEKWERLGVVCPYSHVKPPTQAAVESFRGMVTAEAGLRRFDTAQRARVS